jgi:hypothetical protein
MSSEDLMLDCQCEVRARLPWEALSAEPVRLNLRIGTNLAEYWRYLAEIQIATVPALTVDPAAPLGRRRKFIVIQGGR